MSTHSGILGYYTTPLDGVTAANWHTLPLERRQQAIDYLARYLWRAHLLSLLGDLDRTLKSARAGTYPGKVLDRPTGKVREVPRACSHCKQPTIFTTDRGRSVHPTCEGWIDTLTDEALVGVLFAIKKTIPIARIQELPCLFDPARTLAALATTVSLSSPEMGSASPADTP